MKKAISIILFLGLMLMLMSAVAETSVTSEKGHLDEVAAYQVASEETARLLSVTVERVGKMEYIATYLDQSSFFPDKAVWIITYHDYDFGDPAATIIIESPSGAILESTTDFVWVVRERWEEEKGQYDAWSLEDKMLFDQMFNNPASLSHHAMPLETHIQQEEALQIAIDTLRKEYGVSYDSVIELQVFYSFVSGPQGCIC